MISGFHEFNLILAAIRCKASSTSSAISIALSVSGRLSQRFPAILDPGHSHNLSLSAAHVRDWI
jgi:hypothetical protein